MSAHTSGVEWVPDKDEQPNFFQRAIIATGAAYEAAKQAWKWSTTPESAVGLIDTIKQVITKIVQTPVGPKVVLVPTRLADYLLSDAGPFDLLTFEDTEDIIAYDKVTDAGTWSLNGEQRVKAVAAQITERLGKDIREQLRTHLMKETLNAIQWKTYVARESFTSPLGKIPLVNGVYDVVTGTLEPHNKDNRFLYQVPIKYDPDATCPMIAEFIIDILPADRRTLAYEIAGYMLCANAESAPNRWQRAFMLIGAGDNGKSTYLNVLSKLLGDDNVSNQTLQTLVMNRFAVASLDHKLANIAADIGDRGLYTTNKFKELTGGDKLTAEHKFKRSYEFRNRAIPAFSCNSMPETYDDSNAFHKRWVITQFEAVFTDKKDTKLIEKLTTPEELSGFFNAAIMAYHEMCERGRFTGESETVEKKRELYSKLSDPVQCFIEDHITQDGDGKVIKQEVYAAFRKYTQKHSYGRTFTETHFWKKFREKTRDYVHESWYQEKDEHGEKIGQSHRIFRGINLELHDLGEQQILDH